MSTHDRAHVPCAGCTACCRNELLFLHQEMGDRPADYMTKPAFNPLTGRVGVALQQRKNGDCIYLGAGGCTIHGRAPAICREFDCRLFVARIGGRPAQRRALKSGLVTKDIFDAGRARMHTLKEPAL